MQPLGVVNIGDEVINACAGIGDALEGPRVQLFIFECFHEALSLGIVVWIAGPRHGDGNVMVSQTVIPPKIRGVWKWNFLGIFRRGDSNEEEQIYGSADHVCAQAS